MEYKGYIAKVEFDDEAGLFHGEVMNTRDVITFQGDCVADIRQAFIDSIEDYLEFCASRGEKPEKPFSGRLVLRMPADVHQKVYLHAKASGMSLNEWINKAIQKGLNP
jgi:predicted HicB family RNase H-like nuclease